MMHPIDMQQHKRYAQPQRDSFLRFLILLQQRM
jgi:hypothetical protein